MYRKDRPSPINLLFGCLHPDFLVIFLYRITHYLNRLGVPLIPRVLWLVSRIIFSCDIDYRCQILAGCRFSHAIGIVIGQGVVIGKGVTIYQHTTLGGNFGRKTQIQGRTLMQPALGNSVIVLPGASVLGPIKIGSAVIVGSNAVVTEDIPDESMVVGHNKIVVVQREILTEMLQGVF